MRAGAFITAFGWGLVALGCAMWIFLVVTPRPVETEVAATAVAKAAEPYSREPRCPLHAYGRRLSRQQYVETEVGGALACHYEPREIR